VSSHPVAAAATAVTIRAPDAELAGDLVVPDGATGVVAFAHGSGSGRHSPRNRQVAATLNQAGIATLLLDLLTEAEEHADLSTGHLRFDIGLLARRLLAAIDWLERGPTAGLRIGTFGASTGAAAALIAAAARPATVGAVVSRGGRPDLAGDALRRVHAPTLLIVGGADPLVLDLNRNAFELVAASEKQLVVVRGATHLFEEPGALDAVARLAADWFLRHLQADEGPTEPTA
jgi:putative phosphoribosyl transferase